MAAAVKIRPATGTDLAAIQGIVEAAYAHYVPRIGKRPAPMLADYGAHIRAGEVDVAEVDERVLGAVSYWQKADHMYLDMVAVDPSARGLGLGRRLVGHVECAAREAGLPEVRLYTNARMTENLALYPHLGYTETHRAHHEGYDRVFFVKTVT